MKPLLFILLALPLSLSAQPAGYSAIDAFARSFDERFENAADLAGKLTRPYTTDWEKARVLYAWVANHIRYDVKKARNLDDQVRYAGRTKEEVEANRRKAHDEAVAQTLKKKRGVCQDYSQLYERMATAAGLECVVVTGQARTLAGIDRHAWNAVKVGGAWRLIDATWGAGHFDSDRNRFVDEFVPGYFDTPAKLFALDHLPAEEQWQLLEKPVSKTEFQKQPLVNYAAGSYTMTDFRPEDGKLKRSGGQTEISFRFAGDAPPHFVVTAGGQRQVPAEKLQNDNGWITLRFRLAGGDVVVYGGESGEKLGWMARFR